MGQFCLKLSCRIFFKLEGGTEVPAAGICNTAPTQQHRLKHELGLGLTTTMLEHGIGENLQEMIKKWKITPEEQAASICLGEG